jgi:PhoH-like ATPase
MVTLTNPAPDSHRFVIAASSGASAAVNIYRHYENGSALIFDQVERSSLADFTEKNF